MPLNDAYLASELIERLNTLIVDPEIREDIGRLIESRVVCSQTMMDHESIQVEAIDPVRLKTRPGEGSRYPTERKPPAGMVGFLGVLNGLVGTIPDGARKGWGFIAAEFSDDGKLERFLLTDDPKTTP